jgi:RNA polymerase sigma-70 factor (ECF subfamily)
VVVVSPTYSLFVSSTRAIPKTRSGAGPSDAALVVEARAGESWAQEALFRRHAPRLNGLAFRVMGRDDEVDDLVQDTFVAAFEGLGRLTDPQAFASWIASILVRQAHKKIRRRRMLARLGLGRARSDIDVDAILGASCPPDKAVELRALYGVLNELPADARIALVLRRVEGLSLEEVAEAMDLSLATIKRRLADADRFLEEKGAGR